MKRKLSWSGVIVENQCALEVTILNPKDHKLGATAEAVIDTGAQSTKINSDLIQKTGIKPLPAGSPVEVIDSRNQRSEMEVAECGILVENSLLPILAVIDTETSDPILIGMDFLAQYNGVLSVDRRADRWSVEFEIE